MLGYKINPPPLPRCVERPRLLRRVLAHQVVVLAAPAGSGKTCLAAQLATATGGPTAWFLADELDRGRAEIATQLGAALSVAWSDLGGTSAAASNGDLAVALLGAALETLAGPGCVVMDDVHLLPTDALDAVLRTTVAALPPACRLVVCTRAGVPESLLQAHADGRAATLGFDDLAFDPDEYARVCASSGRRPDELAHTGGWPLAVALTAWGESAPGTYRLVTELADLALTEISPAVREIGRASCRERVCLVV